MTIYKNKTILLVEDEAIISLALAQTIKKFGYDVLSAKTGEDAVNLACSNDSINLILMDIDLGMGMNGSSAAEIILTKKSIPIVFITSHSEREIVEKVRGITRYGYVIKNSGDFVLSASIEMAFELFEAHKKSIENEELITIKNNDLAQSNEELNAALEEMEATNEELISTNNQMMKTQQALLESEHQLRIITNNIPALISYVNADDLRYLFANKAFAQNFGMATEEIIGKQVKDILGEESFLRALPYINRARSGERVEFENIIPVKNEPRWFNINYLPELDEQGKVKSIFVIVFDINERKRVQSESNMLASIVRHSRELINLASADGNMIFLNSAGMNMLGISDEEVHKTNILKVIPEHLLNKVQQEVLPTILENGYWEGDLQYLNLKTGNLTDVHAITFKITNPETGTMQYIANISMDISERLKAEESLHIFKDLVEYSSDAIGMATPEGKHFYQNKAFNQLFGDIGDNPIDVYADKSIGKQLFDSIMQGKNWQGEVKMFGRDKTPLEIFLRAYPLRNKNGYINGLVGLHLDVTQRKQIEYALRENENKFRSVVEKSHIGIAIVNDLSQYTYVNEEFCIMAGYSREEILGKDFSFLLSEESKELTIERHNKLQSGEEIPSLYEFSFIQKTGSKRIGEIRSAIYHDSSGRINSLIQTIDITERKQSEDALRNLQKLESLGVLAGGIAHDFNNLLGGIFGYIELACSSSKETEVIGYLNESLETINRARALTNQLLTFSKGGAPVRKAEHLLPIIRETVQFALSGSNVSHSINIDPDLWPCYIDKNQISQVIDNIIINAQQAMPMGGTIEVTAKNIDHGNKDHSILTEERYVKISIKDFGIGISKEIIPYIFDPFFTTKTKGHGLGLATSYSIINRHEGLLDIDSEPAKGSTFHIYLPASEETAILNTNNLPVKHKGSGTIIVMDDEEFIRNILGKMLKTQGYTCVSMKDGKEVLDFLLVEYKANRAISGIILDLTIPGGLGGKEIISTIREIEPLVPILVISGYADDPVIANPKAFGFTASIGKPFTISELSAVLEKHLNKN